MPTETQARSISESASSMGGAVSGHLPGLRRRNDSNIGFPIQASFGCGIQASMIILRSSRLTMSRMGLRPVGAKGGPAQPASVVVSSGHTAIIRRVDRSAS
jgi:hypothetical protein